MSTVWEYRDFVPSQSTVSELDESARRFYMEGRRYIVRDCHFCCTKLQELDKKIGPYFEGRTSVVMQVCPCCGWWIITWAGALTGAPEGFMHLSQVAGSLKELDSTDISTPTDELKRYLFARYDSRLTVHPKKFEDVVSGVFGDFGYKNRVTSYSGDEGIDIIVLDGEGNDTVGIQVKRYKKKIEAEQIRSFAGALLQKGLSKGIFVTTSSFRRGANKTVEALRPRGMAINLWDSAVFYEKLRLSLRPLYLNVEDSSSPFFELWDDPSRIPTIVQQAW